MENSLSYYRNILLQEIEEKELSHKQKAIAKLDPPKDELNAGDFKAMQAGKKPKMENQEGGSQSTQFEGDVDAINDTQNYFGLKVGDQVKFKDDSVADVKYNANPNTVFKITALYPGHPEVPNPNTHAAIKDQFGNEIKKVYTGYLKKDSNVNEISENEDHEVSMANNSLESIVKAAMELKAKLGDQEKDIPAWIQDHITNAANFISQAADNYHEYGGEEPEETKDSLTSIMEKIINESVENTLKSIKPGVRVKMILDDGNTVTMERVGSNKTGEPTFKHIDKEGKAKGGASTVSASHIKSVKQIKK